MHCDFDINLKRQKTNPSTKNRWIRTKSGQKHEIPIRLTYVTCFFKSNKMSNGDTTNFYQLESDELHGDYSRMLEGWNSLLDRKDIYLLYILSTLQALDGLTTPVSKALDLITECSKMARSLAIRHNSIEWYGKGVGMKRILHYSRLSKSWEEEFEKGERLSLAEGRVSRTFGPEAGDIELSCGLKAFFVPGRGFKRT